jgi:hypothetical protein
MAILKANFHEEFFVTTNSDFVAVLCQCLARRTADPPCFIGTLSKYFKNLVTLEIFFVFQGVHKEIKVDPLSKIFTNIVYKNAIKPKKGVPSPKNFYNPYIPSPQKLSKNLMDPPPGFSNYVHL